MFIELQSRFHSEGDGSRGQQSGKSPGGLAQHPTWPTDQHVAQQTGPTPNAAKWVTSGPVASTVAQWATPNLTNDFSLLQRH